MPVAPLQYSDAATHLRRIEAVARVGSWTLDMPSEILRWSEQTYRIFAIVPGEDITMERFTSLVHVDDRERVRGCWDAALLGADYDVEHRIVLASGEVRWVRERAEFERDDKGTALRALGVVQDISEHKRFEAELLQRFEFEQLVSGLSSRFAAHHDFDGAVNASLAELGRFTGADRAHVFLIDSDGQHVHNTHEWCAEGVRTELANSQNLLMARFGWWMQRMQSGEPLLIEDVDQLPEAARAERDICESQSIRALLDIPVYVRGVLRGYVGLENLHQVRVWTKTQVRALQVFANLVITRLERRSSEQHALRLDEQLAATLEAMTDAFLTMDRQWRVTYMNRAAETITQLQRSDLLGRNIWHAFPEAEGSRFWQEGHQAMESGVANTYEACYEPLSRWLEVRLHPGEAGLAVYFRDITERRESEREREEMATLLRQSQKMEAIGQLAGGVAHDFNNMLSVILGRAELALTRASESERVVEDLLEIRQAGERSAELTRQLLAFARKQPMNRRRLDLNQTIDGMLKMLSRLIGEGIRLLWTPSPTGIMVHMDPAQLDQVMVNLVVNARDAIDNVGEIRIASAWQEITPGNVSCLAPGHYVEISVEDTGIGMDDAVKARVFEPFFTTRSGDLGSGLGLATVYGIVAQNKGEISVDSAPGKGARFRVLLPAQALSAQPAEEVKEPPIALSAGKETILLVEDEELLLTMVTGLLERLGYRVLAAGSPDQALQHGEEHAGSIDLVISDVVMPQMNGRELWARLQPLLPDAQCLFMSGYSAEIIGSEAMAEAGVNFIGKPFRVRHLADKVASVLAQRAATST